MSKYVEEHVVNWWNNTIAAVISLTYALINVYIMAVAIFHQRKIVNGIATRPDLSYTVPEGFNSV